MSNAHTHSPDALYHIVNCVRMSGSGDVAECGVAVGGTSQIMLQVLDSGRTLHLFDTFSGKFPEGYWSTEERDMARKMDKLTMPPDFGTDVDVARNLCRWTNWKMHKGLFSETLPKFEGELSFIFADADLYQSTVEIIQFAERVLRVGGLLLFHDFFCPSWPGVMEAGMPLLKDKRWYAMQLRECTCLLAMRLEK